MTGIEQGNNTAIYWVYFLVCLLVGIGISIYVALVARKNGMLPKNPQQAVWAVILCSGFVVFIYGLYAGTSHALDLFGLFFAAGFPVTIEHFYSTRQYELSKIKSEILDGKL